MSALTVSVSEVAREWIDEKVRSGEFVSAADYLDELVSRDRALSAGDREEDVAMMRAIVEDARSSGLSSRTLDEIFAAAVEITKDRGTYHE